MNPIIRKLGMLVIALSVFLPASAASFSVDGISYNITSPSDKWVEVTNKAVTEENYKGDLVVPDSVWYNKKKYCVMGIGERAFANCDNLTSITIPNSVWKIGNRSFYGCN